MSRSPVDVNSTPSRNEEDHATYLDGWNNLADLIRSGHSFSGRERNCAFLNLGPNASKSGPRFVDVSAAIGFDLPDDGRGMAMVDWDHDGDLDIWLANRTGPRVRMMLNQISEDSSHVTLRLVGTKSNRDAIGARIEVETSDQQTQSKTVRAGDGFLSQSSKYVHFGIPAGTKVEHVRVYWPGKTVPEEFAGILSNSRFQLVEGSSSAKEIKARSEVNLLARPMNTSAIAESANARVILTQRHPLPEIEWKSLDDELHRGLETERGPTLVNLWAGWCAPCLEELDEFKKHADELGHAGIRILALNCDSEANDATLAIDKADLPFTVGFASPSSLESLTEFDHKIFYRKHPLPLPISYLLDTSGNVAAIYKGRTTPQQIIDDALELNQPLGVRINSAVPFGGRHVAKWFAPGRVNVARAYFDAGYNDDAKRELQLELAQPRDSADHVSALRLSAEIAAAENDVHTQLTALRALQDLQPANLSFRLQRAMATAAAGDRAKAKQLLSQIEALAADRPGVLVMVSQACARLGDPDRAIAILQRALEIDPDHAESKMGLALAYQVTGQTQAAIQAYREILDDHPDRLDAANNLAWLLADSKPDEAVQLARHMCDRSKRSRPAYLDTLAYALVRKGDVAEAARVLRAAIPLARGRGETTLVKKMSDRLAEIGE